MTSFRTRVRRSVETWATSNTQVALPTVNKHHQTTDNSPNARLPNEPRARQLEQGPGAILIKVRPSVHRAQSNPRVRWPKSLNGIAMRRRNPKRRHPRELGTAE
jgi:hypothetical protein